MIQNKRLPWQEELAIVDHTMKAISGVTDPGDLVDVYWKGTGELIPVVDSIFGGINNAGGI